MSNTVEVKRGPGRPALVDQITLFQLFATLGQVTVPAMAATLEIKRDTAYATLQRARRSQWIKRVGHGIYALSGKGEQKVATLGL